MARPYDDSEDALLLPVELPELQELLAADGKPVLRHAGYLKHLLTRVANTLAASQSAVRAMQRHIEQQNHQATRIGVPTTLNPLDAVRYLDDEQKERIFDSLTRERLHMLRTLVARAESERVVLSDQMTVVRDVARGLSERTDLPAHVRAEVTRALAALPVAPVAVHHPPMIDIPDPEPRFTPTAPPASRRTPAPDAPPPEPTFVDPYAAPPVAQPAFDDPYTTRPA